jgi:hypothetical protein
MATIGKLVVSLSANSAKLVSELGKTRKSVKKWGADVAKTAAKAGAVFSGLALTLGGVVLVAINRNAAAIDDMTKAAGKLNFPVEDFQKFAYVAGLSNISMDKFGVSMQKMQKSIGDARAGLSTAKDAFAALNLNFNDLANMSPSQQFEMIAEAMKGVGSQADKVKIAMDIFGRSGADLLNVFAGDVKAAGDEFDSLGVTITDNQSRMVAAYQDSKTKLGTLLGGFGKQLTAEVSPAFTLVINKITESIKEMGGMKEAANKFARFIINGMIVAVKAVDSLIVGVKELILTLKQALLMYKIMDNAAGKLVPFGEDYSPENLQKTADEIVALQKSINGGGGVKDKLVSFLDELEKTLDNVGIEPAIVPIVKAASASQLLAEAATEAAKTLDEVSKSKAWKDIFGKEDVTARANQFDQYAKLAKANIESGSSFTGDNIKVLKSILETSTNNGGSGFSTNNLFEKLDLKGMADVISGLESMAVTNQQAVNQQKAPTSKISIDLTSDTGKVAGEIWGEPEFIRGIEAWNQQYMNNKARAVTQ